MKTLKIPKSGYEGEGPDWMSQNKNNGLSASSDETDDESEINNEVIKIMVATAYTLLSMIIVVLLYFFLSEEPIKTYKIKEVFKYIIIVAAGLFCFSAVYSNMIWKNRK